MENLVVALEDGVGEDRLDEEESALLTRLRTLRDEIEAMNVADPVAWRALQRQLEDLSAQRAAGVPPPLPPVASVPHGRRAAPMPAVEDADDRRVAQRIAAAFGATRH